MITSHYPVPNRVNNPYDEITPYNIKRALLDRIQLTQEPNPLENLMIIDQIVYDLLFPSSTNGRKFALAETLILIVTSELTRHRILMEIPQKPNEITISEVYKAIRKDSRTQNTELLGWSYLYYRYVRVDLNIAQSKYCKTASLLERTIYRYENKAILRLTNIVINKEWKARRPHIADRYKAWDQGSS